MAAPQNLQLAQPNTHDSNAAAPPPGPGGRTARGTPKASRNEYLMNRPHQSNETSHTLPEKRVKCVPCLWIDGSKRAIRHARGALEQCQKTTPTCTKLPLLPLIQDQFAVQLPLSRIHVVTTYSFA